MALAGGEVQLHTVAEDAVEQCGDIIFRHLVARDAEAERCDALVQDIEGLLVGFLGRSRHDVLAHIPFVVVLLVAADKRIFAGKRQRCL